MYVQGSIKDQQFQNIATRAATATTEADKKTEQKTDDKTTAAEGKFDQVLGRILSVSGKNEVSEEELFAAIIQERITNLKGEEAGEKYAEQLNTHKDSMRRSDGYVSTEDAARAALKSMVSEGILTESESTELHGQAFQAAQLDDNHEALFDDRGGPNDPTIAVAQMEVALLAARTYFEKLDSGEVSGGNLDLDVGNTGLPGINVNTNDDGSMDIADSSDISEITGTDPRDGAGGFLFKPVSESDGNLVVLLPTKFKGDVESVILRDMEDREIDRGREAGYHNGDRQHFRFSKPGADYGSNVSLEIKFLDGSIQRYDIPNPSERYD